MTEKTLVVLVDLIVYQGLLLDELTADGGLKSLDNLLENRFIEHQLLTIHHGRDITTGQQFASLEDNAVCTGIEYIHP